MTSFARGNWGFLSLITVLVPQLALAASTTFLASRSAGEIPTLSTINSPTLEVPTTVIQEQEDLTSIIEAEATLDITADEAPTDVEIITQNE